MVFKPIKALRPKQADEDEEEFDEEEYEEEVKQEAVAPRRRLGRPPSPHQTPPAIQRQEVPEQDNQVTREEVKDMIMGNLNRVAELTKLL